MYILVKNTSKLENRKVATDVVLANTATKRKTKNNIGGIALYSTSNLNLLTMWTNPRESQIVGLVNIICNLSTRHSITSFNKEAEKHPPLYFFESHQTISFVGFNSLSRFFPNTI